MKTFRFSFAMYGCNKQFLTSLSSCLKYFARARPGDKEYVYFNIVLVTAVLKVVKDPRNTVYTQLTLSSNRSNSLFSLLTTYNCDSVFIYCFITYADGRFYLKATVTFSWI